MIYRYKNGETISFEGNDFVLHDNRWLQLESKESYARYVENYKNPKGGKPWSRELKATFAYNQKLVQTAGIIDGAFGGAAGITVSLLKMNYKLPTPIVLFSSLFWGQMDTFKEMQERMEIHDNFVENNRRKK